MYVILTFIFFLLYVCYNHDGMKDGYIKAGTASPYVCVADTQANAERIISIAREAEEKGIKILVFPEMSITGYTIGDLVFSRDLLVSAQKALRFICEETRELDLIAVAGLPLCQEGKIYNTAAVIHHGRVLAFIPKTNIPSYGEFYEGRWFEGAFKGVKTFIFDDYEVPFGTDILIRSRTLSSFCLAVELCEDLWVPSSPSVRHALAGATVIANLSASDELTGKDEYRKNLVSMQSARLLCGYIYANAGEGESTTDMVFAGHSLIAENGVVLASQFLNGEHILETEIDTAYLESERMKHTTFKVDAEGYTTVWTDFTPCETWLTRKYPRFPFVPSDSTEMEKRCERIITLQALGLKKRLEHTRSKGAVIGLSGGLDSTLALLVTVKAFDMLKRDRKDIHAITMPCFGTTKRTRSNAETLATALGVSFEEVNIRTSVLSHFKDIGQDEKKLDVTYENAQARERTQVLMDRANMLSSLVIGTGDLSELALGWATYNGDHMSMYAVNASVPKTLVRYLVGWFATCDFSGSGKVLEDILDTPVSPELLPANEDGSIAQVTEDLVGPYELHDFFLYYFVRTSFSRQKIRRIALKTFEGVYEPGVIDKWLDNFFSRFFSQQFKRSCLPDGPKVGSLTLSPRSDWRMPSDASNSIWK